MDNCIRIPIAAALSVLVVATAMADAPHSLILFVPDGPRARSINPSQCVVVEDAISGIQSAQAAGIGPIIGSVHR